MYTYTVKLIKVVDGDTIDVNVDLGFDVWIKKRVRFLGVNAPESRTRDKEEKVRGLAAKDRVIEVLENCNTLQLKSHGVGKFGRCLGEIHIDRLNDKDLLTLRSLNELLLTEGHAVEYHGGKR